jgi:hypothetical protein
LASLNGVWEREGRNPLVAAFLLVVGAGSIYFIVQTVVLNGAIMIDMAVPSDAAGEPQSVYKRYQWLILGVLVVTQYALLLLPTLVVTKRWHTPERTAYLRADRFSLGGTIVATVGIVALLPIVGFIAEFFYSLAPELEELQGNVEELVTSDSIVGQIGILFAIAVTPAVCEEFMFRGYFQRTLERRMRGWHFVLSGAIFALFHQQVLTLPSLVLVGVFLSYVFFAFGSVWITVIAHFVYNGLQIVVANYLGPIEEEATGEAFTLPVLLVAVVVVAGMIVLAERHRRRRLVPAEESS